MFLIGLYTVFAAVGPVESSGVYVVQRINSSTVPKQPLNLATGFSAFEQRVFVHHVQLPQIVILYPLNLP